MTWRRQLLNGHSEVGTTGGVQLLRSYPGFPSWIGKWRREWEKFERPQNNCWPTSFMTENDQSESLAQASFRWNGNSLLLDRKQWWPHRYSDHDPRIQPLCFCGDPKTAGADGALKDPWKGPSRNVMKLMVFLSKTIIFGWVKSTSIQFAFLVEDPSSRPSKELWKLLLLVALVYMMDHVHKLRSRLAHFPSGLLPAQRKDTRK